MERESAFTVPLLSALCLALGVLAAAEAWQEHTARGRETTEEKIAQAALDRADKWRADALALRAGAQDTDATLKRTHDDLAICVGRLLVAESRRK